MPTYAYQCKDCAHTFDIVQAFSEDSLTVCPECQGTLRKKFGNVGVTFKGSGFYRTDSRGSSSSSTANSTTSNSASSNSTSGSSASSTSTSAASTTSASAA